MTRRNRHRAVGWVTLAAILLAAAGLVAAGLRQEPVRTFALRVPDHQQPAAVLEPDQHPCEGPIDSPGAFTGVGIFGMTLRGTPFVRVDIRSRGGRLLATGTRVMYRGRRRERFIRLDHTVPGSTPATVCLSALHGRYVVFGSAVGAGGITAHMVFPGIRFSLVTTRRSSFIDSLGTAFRRESVFRPDWIGAWTFWLLLGLLAAAGSGLIVLAVSTASRDDDRAE